MPRKPRGEPVRPPHRRGRIWRAIRNSPGIQIAIYFVAFAMLVGLYTLLVHAFYPVLENKPLSWIEALLFVVESMTTVGYGWLLPFHNELMMLIAIQIMMTGVIMIFMVIPLLIAPFLSTLLAPAPPRKTPHVLYGHIVVIGYDELAKSIVNSLMIADHDIVIIEEDKQRALGIATDYRRRAYVVWGDYTDPETWAGAHLNNAAFLVICKNERMTANIILGARKIVQGKIISIVDKLSFERYLRYAGADYVLSPKNTTGRILARHAVLYPASAANPDIPGIDRISISAECEAGAELRLINIPVIAGCHAAGKTLHELRLVERYGVLVLFLWRSGTFVARPGAEDRLEPNTSLFLFGRAESIIAAIRDEFTADGHANALAVIAGFGDVGSAAYQELRSAGIACRVVDAALHDADQVIGNAEDETVLRNAGIGQAQYCIIALNDDDVNIFTTLMARNLNPDIRILARANLPGTVDKLYRAGADYVALLPMIGGQTVGRIVLADTVTVLLDLPNSEIVVMRQVKRAAGRTTGPLAARSGVRIIGIEAVDRAIVSPPPDSVLREGDTLIVMGDTVQLKKFLHLI